MTEEVIGRIGPKPARRVVATGILGVLGMTLIYIASTTPPAAIGWLLFLIALGAGFLYLSWRLWEVTSIPLELTREELRETGGRILCRIENVASVDRGFFAFKPSNGFLVRLKEPAPDFIYVPGLWWRHKRTLMVGGVTSGAEAKSVADLMNVLLVERGEGR